jgi:hypothetical protein
VVFFCAPSNAHGRRAAGYEHHRRSESGRIGDYKRNASGACALATW